MPDSVRTAAKVMYLGALLAVAQGIASIVTLAGQSHGAAFVQGLIFILVETSLMAFLWRTMAVGCEQGNKWGRVMAAILTGVTAVGLFAALVTGHSLSGATIAIESVVVVAGAVANRLLWNAESSEYFARTTAVPYGYGPPSESGN